ncbi:MAG: hypothetical protein AAGD07_08310 [Planctomycetota bacterium]
MLLNFYHLLKSSAFLALGTFSIAATGDGIFVDEVYRETKGQVQKVSVDLQDPYLQVFVMAESDDRGLHRPIIYHLGKHKTFLGVRDVEKVGRVVQIVATGRPFLHLPVGENIQQYVLLIRAPVLAESGMTIESWRDWRLFKAKKLEVAGGSIRLPKFDEMTLDIEHNPVIGRIVRRYESEAAKGVKEMKTPIKPGDPKPWWTW